MKNFPISQIIIPTLMVAPLAHGAVIMETFDSGALNQAIPDGSQSGLTSTMAVTSAIMEVQSVTVDLGISGSFNGDLYAYLVHESGRAVLLNRSGKTASNAIGYPDGGFTVTLDDAATNNIHTYQDISVPMGPLTGTWQPDGRDVDPANVLDTDPATATLSALTTDDPNGDWTLFVADISSGETHQLVDWSITITGDTVPEPTSLALTLLGCLALCHRRR